MHNYYGPFHKGIQATYAQEVFRVTQRNAFRNVLLEEVVGRCYVTTPDRYEKYYPVNVTTEHIFICNKTYDNVTRRVSTDSDIRPYTENVDLKSFEKRDQRLRLKRKLS